MKMQKRVIILTSLIMIIILNLLSFSKKMEIESEKKDTKKSE